MKYAFIFTPKIGELIRFDEHIFQMGWFNHQPGNVCFFCVFFVGGKVSWVVVEFVKRRGGSGSYSGPVNKKVKAVGAHTPPSKKKT